MFWWLYYADSQSADFKDLPLVMWLQVGPRLWWHIWFQVSHQNVITTPALNWNYCWMTFVLLFWFFFFPLGWTRRIWKWFWKFWGNRTFGQRLKPQKDELGRMSDKCCDLSGLTKFPQQSVALIGCVALYAVVTAVLIQDGSVCSALSGSGCQCVIRGQPGGHRLQLHRDAWRLCDRCGHGRLRHAGVAQAILHWKPWVPGLPDVE